MPTRVVDITLSTETAAVPQETFNDVAVVGTASSSPPSANFGEANLYSSASDVDSDYGSNADVTTASNALEEMGVESWYVVVLEETQVTGETLTESSLETLANNSILGDPTPTVNSGDLTFVAGTPDTGITSGTELNTDTGDYYTAESSNTIDYSYVDWTQLDTALEGLGIDLIFKADTQFDREHIGSLDDIVSWGDGHEAAVVAASVNGSSVADEQTAMDIAHDVGSYVSSGALLHVAHKSSDDVAAYIIGQVANENPWFDPFYDGDGYPFNTEFYRDVNVGDPATAGTFEGGDQANQEGPTNVVINKAGTTVLSNSITTAGASSNYQFWDVKRTEDYAAAQIEAALTSLRLRAERIPFTPEGRALIKDAIQGAFAGDVGGINDPFSSVSVFVPEVSTLTDSDRANRIYSGIQVDATLSGNVHEFTLSLNVQV
jgi:hypothetical protein